MRWIMLIAPCLSVFSSCTTLSFHSEGRIPLHISPRAEHGQFVETKGVKQFFLWGLIGPDNIVEVDKELSGIGLFSAANISVHEYQSSGSWWSSFLSLGLYIPKNYKITAWGAMPDEDRATLTRRANTGE